MFLKIAALGALLASVSAHAESRKLEVTCYGATSTSRSLVLQSEISDDAGRVVRIFQKGDGQERLLREIHGANPVQYFDIMTFRNKAELFILDIGLRHYKETSFGKRYQAFLDTRFGNTDVLIEMECQLP